MAESQTESLEIVVRILRKVLKNLPADHVITQEDRFADLHVTSLQLMQIIAAVEQTLDVEFPDSAFDLATFESVSSLTAVVDSLVLGRAG
ncbi:acyl carrier protein [Streptomyces sp. NPDC001401]|uniref:acyl carrier protein n=1 Tax=Streptomyces sp. NPDC001401 TaxID=3364570 RepID=UPI0036AEEF8F